MTIVESLEAELEDLETSIDLANGPETLPYRWVHALEIRKEYLEFLIRKVKKHEQDRPQPARSTEPDASPDSSNGEFPDQKS